MDSKDRNPYLQNMALATVAGQSGCFTVMVIFLALFLGLWLDKILDTRPVFTLGLLLTSIPLSLVMMVYVVLKTTSQMTPPQTPKSKGRIIDREEEQ